ncbi:MAG: hypothetical protein DRP20_03175 [Thermotogae bacterium]|nr:MAG: hypothetical protein DRP20_03175 [Thermotogota bacterium]
MKKYRGLIFVLPVIILVLFIVILPIITMLNNSLRDVRFGFEKNPAFTGLKNYLDLLEDETFIDSIGKSFLWTAENLLIQLTVPLLLALLLNRKGRFYQFVRSVLLIPWILPMVVVSIVWRWLLEPNIGYVNYLIKGLGLPLVNFLGSTSLAFHILVLINSWHFIPFGTILMLAALSTIPTSLYDAAKVDGANSFRRLIHITFPLIGRIIWFVGLLAFMWSFNTFDLIWLTTQGGPANSTMTLPTYIYKLAFKTYEAGRASAAALISTLILIGVAVIYFIVFTPREKKGVA